MDIVLRQYQVSLEDEIVKALIDYNRILAVSPTGGGKSINIASLANKLPGRTLILTHRTEILIQNSNWLVDVGTLSAKGNSVGVFTDVVIAMVETLAARIKKYGIEYIGVFDNIIVDEVHIDTFKKVYDQYKPNKLIGFTATPLSNKKQKKVEDDVEYSRMLSMSRDFEVLVQGANEQDLIDQGFLTQDFNVVLKPKNFNLLKQSESAPDGYTSNSLNSVYANKASYDILYDAYTKYGKGKKAILFNATTKVNLETYNYFKSMRVNCKLFDTVNKQKGETRKSVVEWFKNQDEALLINANVFTTGFDDTEIECVIVNRATKSLSLWLQMVGRGARISDKIFKDKFTVLDLGNNIEEHGRWSTPRDWAYYFKVQPWKRKNKQDMLQTWDCLKCGAINIKGEKMRLDGVIVCEYCDAERRKKEKKGIGGKLVELDKPKPPTANQILQYCIRNNKDANFAFQIVKTKLLELFVGHDVTKKEYEERKKDFDKRINNLFRGIYFAILKSDLKGKNRRLQTEMNDMITKIEKYYGN